METYNQTVTAYNSYKNGFLPHAGGMMDQNCFFPHVMDALDSAITACEKVKAKNAETQKRLQNIGK